VRSNILIWLCGEISANAANNYYNHSTFGGVIITVEWHVFYGQGHSLPTLTLLRAALSTPALSTLASSYHIVHSCDVHPCFFVPNCPIPHFLPLHFCPCHAVHSRDFSRPETISIKWRITLHIHQSVQQYWGTYPFGRIVYKDDLWSLNVGWFNRSCCPQFGNR